MLFRMCEQSVHSEYINVNLFLQWRSQCFQLVTKLLHGVGRDVDRSYFWYPYTILMCCVITSRS